MGTPRKWNRPNEPPGREDAWANDEYLMTNDEYPGLVV